LLEDKPEVKIRDGISCVCLLEGQLGGGKWKGKWVGAPPLGTAEKELKGGAGKKKGVNKNEQKKRPIIGSGGWPNEGG